MVFVSDRKRHLVCLPYSLENLHLMAERLGIDSCWFHSKPYPHYDIPKRRIQEIEAICKIVSPKVIVKICRGEYNEHSDHER